MTELRRFVAAVLLSLLWPASAVAAGQADIRAAAHDGFGRIAFDFPAPVQYAVHVKGTTLTIHFSRPLDARADGLSAELAAYVADARLEAKGRTLVVRLKRPVSANAFTVRDKTVVVDLTPRAALPHPAPAPLDAKQAKPETAKLHLVVATDGDTTRVTFAWTKPVRYEFSEKDGTVRLFYRGGGAIDEAALAAALPTLAPTVAQRNGMTVVAMTVPAGTRFQHFRHGKAMTIEVTRPRRDAPAPVPASAPEKAAAPAAASAADPAPALAPASASDSAVDPAPAPALVSSPPSAATVAAPPASPPPAVPVAAAPASEPAAPPPSVAVHFTAADSGASLSFDWPVATGAAVFRHGGSIWVVFALPTTLDLADPLAHGQSSFSTITQVPAKGAYGAAPGAAAWPCTERAARGQRMDHRFQAQPSPVDAPIAFEVHSGAMPADAAFRVHQAECAGAARRARARRRARDRTGGRAWPRHRRAAATGRFPRASQPTGHRDPAVRRRSCRPRRCRCRRGVAARGDCGCPARATGCSAMCPSSAFLVRFRRLARTRGREFRGRTQRARARHHRRAARRAVAAAARAGAFLFRAFVRRRDHGRARRRSARDDPQTASQPAVRALMGAACVLAEDRKCAAAALGQNSLDGEPEAALWRGALASEAGDWKDAATDFLASVSLLPTYPKTLRARFALEAARGHARDAADEPRRPAARSRAQRSSRARGQGHGALSRRAQGAARWPSRRRAIAYWDKAAALDDPPSRARALYDRALALYAAKRASRADTVKALDALRFAWRGGSFEFTLLRRLGELKLAEDDDAGGLDALAAGGDGFPRPAHRQGRRQGDERRLRQAVPRPAWRRSAAVEVAGAL